MIERASLETGLEKRLAEALNLQGTRVVHALESSGGTAAMRIGALTTAASTGPRRYLILERVAASGSWSATTRTEKIPSCTSGR